MNIVHLPPALLPPGDGHGSRPLLSWLGILLLGSGLQAADPFAENVRPTEPLTPDQEQKSFHLPPGFEIQWVAAEPDINKPMNLAFDAADPFAENVRPTEPLTPDQEQKSFHLPPGCEG